MGEEYNPKIVSRQPKREVNDLVPTFVGLSIIDTANHGPINRTEKCISEIYNWDFERSCYLACPHTWVDLFPRDYSRCLQALPNPSPLFSEHLPRLV